MMQVDRGRDLQFLYVNIINGWPPKENNGIYNGATVNLGLPFHCLLLQRSSRTRQGALVNFSRIKSSLQWTTESCDSVGCCEQCLELPDSVCVHNSVQIVHEVPSVRARTRHRPIYWVQRRQWQAYLIFPQNWWWCDYCLLIQQTCPLCKLIDLQSTLCMLFALRLSILELIYLVLIHKC